MQPPHAPVKSVMDISAPSRPAPVAMPAPRPAAPAAPPAVAAQPVAPAPTPTSQSMPSVTQHMDVAKAPDQEDGPLLPAAESIANVALTDTASAAVEHQPAATTKGAAKTPKPLPQGPHLPVGLITVTILVMLALSGIAVMVYMTA